MTVIRPFSGIRPADKLAASIAALPYDVYNRTEAKKAVQTNPLSFLKIDRAETQLSDNTDMYSEEVYARARDTFSEMLENGAFVRDDTDCFYLYALTMDGRTQTGIVGCASIDDYLDGTIRKHENTRADKELDRIRHIDALSAQTGPIFLAYRQTQALHDITEQVKSNPPLSDFISEDNIRHQVWKISDTRICSMITQHFAQIRHVYIADGHHRAASAVKVGLKRREAYQDYNGSEEFNYFLSVLFPAEELKIYDYNRVVEDMNGYTADELLRELQKDFHADIIQEAAGFDGASVDTDSFCRPAAKGEFSMYCGGIWYRLKAKPHVLENIRQTDLSDALQLENVHRAVPSGALQQKKSPVDTLDVSILQDTILCPLLGIKDPKTDPRIWFVGGIRGLKELVRLVDEKPGRIAFAMYPTSMDELLAVADAGGLMPPKSTWFEPKLRSGLFIHEFER